jgi:hypothetical protein
MYHLRRFTFFVVVLLCFSFLAWLLPRVLNPAPPGKEKQRRDQEWIDTSPYWLDRQACRWLSLCGLHHVRPDPPTRPKRNESDDGELRLELRSLAGLYAEREEFGRWETARSNKTDEESERGGERALRDVPQFVLDYAPLVHLYSGENFWPADIAEHVRHMKVIVNGTEVSGFEPLSLGNMRPLNQYEPGTVFLTSKEDVETRPEWLHSHVGEPSPFDDGGDEPDTPGDSHGPEGDEEGRRSRDGTTWYDVGRNNPLHRISDPRKFPTKSTSRLIQKLLFQRHNLFSMDDRSDKLSPAHLPTPKPPNQTPILPLSSSSSSSSRGYKPDAQGYSKAPAVLILVDKGSGILDAFWFFFYSYNLGQTVLGTRYGNHVGDWEHCMLRFEDGIPRGVFFSEHEGGQAYTFGAVEKHKPTGRPVIYSAVGSHAMYPLPGDHPYVLPFKILKDVTDKGPMWDPARNIYAYHYDPPSSSSEHPTTTPGDRDQGEEQPKGLVPAASNPDAPTSWFHYEGPWGDELYTLADERQWRLFGQYHYVTGPQGPKFKRLDRAKVCQNDKCRILYSLKPGQTWY